MFTGIVEEVGRVAAVERGEERARLVVDCDVVVEGAATGGSVAVDGCCLTMTTLTPHGFVADLMAETLHVTALGDLAGGDAVNLERPLRLGDRLDGHVVQGHVDGVGRVTARDDQPGMVVLEVAAPAHLAPYLAAKGSVAVQGVSLTVVDVDADDARFRVGLIPHTCAVTTLGALRVGDRVNLEVDVIAKYVERLLVSGGLSGTDGGAVRKVGDRG